MAPFLNARRTDRLRRTALSAGIPGESEAQVEAAVAAQIPAAKGGTQGPRTVEPGAAAEHAPGAIALFPGGAVRWRAIILVVPAVLGPLPDITVHIL